MIWDAESRFDFTYLPSGTQIPPQWTAWSNRKQVGIGRIWPKLKAYFHDKKLREKCKRNKKSNDVIGLAEVKNLQNQS